AAFPSARGGSGWAPLDRRFAGTHSRHRVSRPDHAPLHGQRRRVVAVVSAERRCGDVAGGWWGWLRLGCGERRRDHPGARMKGAWAWMLAFPPLAMTLLFFIGPLVYLFWVSLPPSSKTELYA